MPPRSLPESVAIRPHPAVCRVADLMVDTRRVTVRRSGQELALPHLTFDLLVALIEAAPRVLSVDELMERVWPGLVVGPETVSQRVKLLRDALGDDPKRPRYVAGVRGRGYRLLPEVIPVDETGAVSPGVAQPASIHASHPLRIAALGLGIACVAGLAAWLLVDREQSTAPAPASVSPSPPPLAAPVPARSVAVLDFENRDGSPRTGILAEGIPETVLYQLARFPDLTVIARSSSFAFQGQAADLRDIGRRLNVHYLLEGTVQSAGGRLRVTSSLVDAESGASVWSMQFDRALGDVFAVQDEIALEVARAMQLTMAAGTDAVATLQHGGTAKYQAYLAFLRGRALLESARVADLPKAADSLAAAIRDDPDFAGAYVLLARARTSLAEQRPASDRTRELAGAVGESIGLLDQAIRLDPQNGEAYVERGFLNAYFDLAAADADLRRGIELSPNYARGYEGLAAVMFQSVARRREALDLIGKARRLDPLAPRLDVLKASYLFWGAGNTQQAVAILEAVLEREPLYVPAIVRLAEVRWSGQGELAESAQLAEQAVSLDPGNEPAWRQLVTSYLEMGDMAAAVAAQRAAPDPDIGTLAIHLHRNEWRAAGEIAYGMIAAGNPPPQTERLIALAIDRYARATGQYEKAIGALASAAHVEWDGDDPVLQGQLDLGYSVTALADVMAASGRAARATVLLEAFLADANTQVTRYGRGAGWLNDARAAALALLGRPADAMAILGEQLRTGFGNRGWQISREQNPAFDVMRSRKDFQALLATARAHALREREQLLKMRAEGLVPDRR